MTSICRLLGFDFGLKRIGVASGQTITQSAQPLCTLKAEKGSPDWSAVKKLIEDWRPDALVVGLPLNMDGTRQPITEKARQFSQALEHHCALPVYTEDERLTTIEARSRIFEKAGFKALQRQEIDAVAAQLILESWMAHHAND